MIRIEAKELNNHPTYSINVNVNKQKGQNYDIREFKRF